MSERGKRTSAAAKSTARSKQPRTPASSTSRKRTPPAVSTRAAGRRIPATPAVDGANGQWAAQSTALSTLSAAVEDLRQELRHLKRSTSQVDNPKEEGYDDLARRIRLLVGAWLPADATLLVVSKGDESLLDLPRGRCWHFPRTHDGDYSGYYPASSQAAIIHLEALRADGATHLLVPATSGWWLDFYDEFQRHLGDRYTRVLDEPTTCSLWSLTPRVRDRSTSVEDVITAHGDAVGGPASVLDWTREGLTTGAIPGVVFTPLEPAADTLAYLDKSVDFVVIDDERRRAEATRVAGVDVITATKSAAGLAFDAAMCAERRASLLPSTSVVIPTYNGADHVRRCLTAIEETVEPDVDAEFLVVDDGSTDETEQVVADFTMRDPRIKFVRSPRNAGFINACSRGAAAASKEILLFLNNDTIPLPNWLEPVLQTFVGREDVGVVGGKLVFPDGTLQEAGGVMFNDASGANYGKFDRMPDDPIFSHVRDVDYCSGAHLATPRRLFKKLGGFDKQLRPAYYEDTDYCFAVRAAGLRVLYQPESVVIHLEGATAGRDLQQGMKKHQVANREKFLAKWGHVLIHHQSPPSHYDRSTWHSLGFRDYSKTVGR